MLGKLITNNPIINKLKSSKLSLIRYDVQEIVSELPNPFDNSEMQLSPQLKTGLEQLRKDGICILPGFFAKEKIESIRKSYQSHFENKTNLKEIKEDGVVVASAVLKPLQHCPSLVELALDKNLLALCAGYFRKKVKLAEAALERLDPLEFNRLSYQWHFDKRGKQLKAMILFTDVDENGQHFTYIKGTHRHRFYLERAGSEYGDNSRISDAEAESYDLKNNTVRGIGLAGTVVLFDTNGIHKGSRKKTYRRETCTFNYKVGKFHMHPLHIPDEVTKKLSQEELSTLRLNTN